MPDLTIKVYKNDLPNSIIHWCNKVAWELLEPSFFCTGDWLKSAARFEENTYIITVVGGIDRNLVAVLPLTIKHNVFGAVYARVIGSRFHPDPVGLICEKHWLKEAAAKIRKHFEYELNWDSLTLDWTTYEECRAWGVNGEDQTVAPYLPIEAGFEDILSRFRKKKRYNLRASTRQLLKEKGASFIECVTPEDKLSSFRELLRLHRVRSQERGIKSSVDDPAFYEHHSNLLQYSDCAKIFSLSLDGQTLAVIYGFAYANRFFYYQVAHDPKYAGLSPGKVLLYQVIKHYCDQGFKEFNFLQGDEEYKWFWTSEKRQLVRLRLERNNLRTRVFRFLSSTKRYLSRTIKELRHGH